MQFDLVDRRNDAGGVDENGQVLGLEIADSDGPDPALVAQSGESLEGLDIFVERRLRPVDQVEIEVVESKPAHARVECLQRAVVALVCIPQFGHQVELVTRHAGFGNRSPDLSFVTVGRRGVDMPVAGAQRSAYRQLGVCRGDLENSETDGRDQIAVVQRDCVSFEGAAHDQESARRSESAPSTRTCAAPVD